MNFGWIGAVTDGGFTAAVEVTGPVLIRLAVSTSSDMSSPVFSSSIVDADGWHKLSIAGLSADTVYFWSLEEDAVVGAAEGSIRTFPTEGSAASFTMAASSCRDSDTNPNTFARIQDRAPAFFMHMGDMHYENISTNSASLYEAAYEEAIGQSTQTSLYKNIPTFYMWDDHDYGPNSSDSTSPGRPAALTTYRKVVPHPPLAFSGPDDDTPISFTFVCGRIRFVQLDIRSEAILSSNILIGTDQLNWLTNLIETFTEPLMVIDVSTPWIHGSGGSGDSWGEAPTEREAICNAIQEHAQGRVIIIHGDAHMVAMDDGTNSNFATAPSGPGPRVCGFAPLNQTNSIKGGPYSEGTFGANNTQYGTLAFADDGSAITITATGYRATDDAVLVSMEWEVGGIAVSDQIVYWAEDVTEADAFPANTVCYVETDGPNPTRVRLNGEWSDITTYLRDGAYYSLSEIIHLEIVDSVTARAVSSGVLNVNGKVFVSASVTGVATVSGEATLKIIPVSEQILYWAEDVFVADAFPEDTAAYVLTDGPNPTRVRLNEEWRDIDIFIRDGTYYSLTQITLFAPELESSVTAKAVSEAVVHSVVQLNSEVLAVTVSSGESTRFANPSVTVQARAVASGDFTRSPSFVSSVTGVAQAQASISGQVFATSTVTAVANSESEIANVVSLSATVVAVADTDASPNATYSLFSEIQARAVSEAATISLVLPQGSTIARSEAQGNSDLLRITRRPSSTVTARAVATGSLGASAEVVAIASTQAAASITHNSMAAEVTALSQVEAFADIHVPVSSSVTAVANSESDAIRLYRMASFVTGVASSTGDNVKKSFAASSVIAVANVFGKWLKKRPFSSSVTSLATISGELFTTIQSVAELVGRASVSLDLEAAKTVSSTLLGRASVDIQITVTPTLFVTSQVTAKATFTGTEGVFIFLSSIDNVAVARTTGRIRGVLAGAATIPRTASVAFENRKMEVFYSHREMQVRNKKVTSGV